MSDEIVQIIVQEERPTVLVTPFQLIGGGGGGASTWDELSGKPSGLVSSSAQITSVDSAVSASYAPTILPTGVVSSSAQIVTVATASLANSVAYQNVTGRPTLVSASAQISYAGIANVPTGIVSSSVQVDYNSIQNQPSTIPTSSLANAVEYQNVTGRPTLVSASDQVQYTGLSGIPNGIVSSSTQIQGEQIQGTVPLAVTASYALTNAGVVALASTASYVAYSDVDEKPTLVSASSQIDFNSIQNQPTTIATASLANAVEYANIANKPSLVSSSGQIDYQWIQNQPTTIPTASLANAVEYVNVANKPTLVSSSAQISYTSISDVPVGILSSSTQFNALSNTSASYAASTIWTGVNNKPTGIVSSSGQVAFGGITGVPTGLVSSSGQVDYSGIANVPTGILSSSTQFNALTNTSASHALNANNANAANTSSFVANSYATLNVSLAQTGSIINTGYRTSVDIPARCQIEQLRIRSNVSGSIHFDLRQSTQAAFLPTINGGTSITGSGAAPSMSNNQTYQDASLTNWTTVLEPDNVLSVIVRAVSGSANFDTVNLSLKCKRI